mmetsp:Transcript_75733/g.126280  ORF Transcript_75733/g.126280 Transcript_75733/m.126280 type:complete len:150 (+) Transcript_75733:58-507(+)|eukprot:CAMPEP_0119335442 /NCGR_PEP_ID=MMETSP1333-20130426/89627_1 /TAXON_ID=418940 /ORGANISM="Scyphosphaera apsteinii, Strain RCC1455" /LENGTH=149 /DNA_ID=CAMNT_0007345993 /DNA_START=58 /DNA_END=507 /DNA_ORIENTATION=+
MCVGVVEEALEGIAQEEEVKCNESIDEQLASAKWDFERACGSNFCSLKLESVRAESAANKAQSNRLQLLLEAEAQRNALLQQELMEVRRALDAARTEAELSEGFKANGDASFRRRILCAFHPDKARQRFASVEEVCTTICQLANQLPSQ